MASAGRVYKKGILFLIGSIWPLFVSGITFEIIIPSFNNEKWCVENLRSAVSQQYDDFHITYIDDCSTDATGPVVDAFVKSQGVRHRVTIIHNIERYGALENLYRVIHGLPNATVAVLLDGDDFLAHGQVLKTLNEVYSCGRQIWLTYGNFTYWPSGAENLFCRPFPSWEIEQNGFRSYPIIGASHLRTFKAGLFKKIRLEDLLYEGNFYPMTWDLAMMMPMLEMAGERHTFIPEVLYHYNLTNNQSDHVKDGGLQNRLNDLIRSKPPYRRLEKLDE